MSREEETVLITGAGPTGLVMANLLSRMDIPFFLIDKEQGPSRDSKAFGIHARSLEIFDQLGVAKRAVNEGNIDNTIHLIVKGREAEKVRLTNILPGETNYPYLLILQQNKLEKILIDSLEEQGQTVHWKHELTQLEQNKKGVTVTIRNGSGEEKKSRFQYLIGCDGAGSTVRKQAGFSFKGKTFSPTFYLADCEINWQYPHGDIYFIFSPRYLSGVFSFPEKNRYRIFNFMNSSVGKGENSKLSSEDIQNILDSNPNLSMEATKIDWTSVFKIHSRYTSSFKKDRIFLAGDAAHVHSPAGAQGMNTGIQDSYNLAWKLSLVIKEKAKPKLLNTYNEERYKIAKKLHQTTDRLFQLMTHQNKLMDFFRLYIIPKVFKILFGIKWLRKQNFRRLSQLAINYRYSSLSKEGSKKGFYRKAPKPGDRAPYCKMILNREESDIFQLFKCTHFTLLIAFSDPENQEAAKNINDHFTNLSILPMNIHNIAPETGGSFFDVYGVKKNAVFIVRPDGYIGFCSSGLDFREIKDYLNGL